MSLDPETTKALIQMIPEHTLELLFDPAADATGKALGGLLKGAFSWLIKLGIKKDAEFADLANQVANKYEDVPENNRDKSKILFLIKALQQVEYQIDIKELRRLYANLIVNTVDDRKNDFVTPRVISILGEFGEKEAQFLKILSEQDKFRMPYSESIILSTDKISYRPLSRKVLCTENNEILLDYDTAIDTLTSLGLIKLREGQKFVADYYKNQYSMIENKVNSQDWHAALLPGEKLDIRCSNLRTTILGKEFIENIVIDSE